MPTGICALLERFDLARQPLRQRHAAAADADEGELVQVLGLLQDLVRQPDQRPVDLGGAHQLGFFARKRHRWRLKKQVSKSPQFSPTLPLAYSPTLPRRVSVASPALPLASRSYGHRRALKSWFFSSSSQQPAASAFANSVPFQFMPRRGPRLRDSQPHPGNRPAQHLDLLEVGQIPGLHARCDGLLAARQHDPRIDADPLLAALHRGHHGLLLHGLVHQFGECLGIGQRLATQRHDAVVEFQRPLVILGQPGNQRAGAGVGGVPGEAAEVEHGARTHRPHARRLQHVVPLRRDRTSSLRASSSGGRRGCRSRNRWTPETRPAAAPPATRRPAADSPPAPPSTPGCSPPLSAAGPVPPAICRRRARAPGRAWCWRQRGGWSRWPGARRRPAPPRPPRGPASGSRRKTGPGRLRPGPPGRPASRPRAPASWSPRLWLRAP